MYIDNSEILLKEFENLKFDIIKKYESSGKKVTGEFARGLDIKLDKAKVTLLGYEYLAGRKGGIRPPVENIKKWVRDKGIFKYKNESQLRGIAYVIARNIGRKGTSAKYRLNVYNDIITPNRIDLIISHVIENTREQLINEIKMDLKTFA